RGRGSESRNHSPHLHSYELPGFARWRRGQCGGRSDRENGGAIDRTEVVRAFVTTEGRKQDMSKGGGAGKVYFILYLAVLLELLIIIVERDDAEEELKKEKLALEQKSKRIQMIAETIIQALRGSQTSL